MVMSHGRSPGCGGVTSFLKAWLRTTVPINALQWSPDADLADELRLFGDPWSNQARRVDLAVGALQDRLRDVSGF